VLHNIYNFVCFLCNYDLWGKIVLKWRLIVTELGDNIQVPPLSYGLPLKKNQEYINKG